MLKEVKYRILSLGGIPEPGVNPPAIEAVDTVLVSAVQVGAELKSAFDNDNTVPRDHSWRSLSFKIPVAEANNIRINDEFTVFVTMELKKQDPPPAEQAQTEPPKKPSAPKFANGKNVYCDVDGQSNRLCITLKSALDFADWYYDIQVVGTGRKLEGVDESRLTERPTGAGVAPMPRVFNSPYAGNPDDGK